MSLATRVQDITSRFAAQTELDEGRICWEFLGAPHGESGGAFVPPAIDPSNPEAAIWQRVTVRHVPNSSRPWGINNAPRYAEGVIAVDTFFPKYSSPKTALEYADAAATIFHRQQFGVVRCGDADGPDFLEVDLWPNFKIIHVLIPFYIYEVN